MMSIFDPTLALTLLTHPFQVSLMAVTVGALVRQGICAWIVGQTHAVDGTTIADTNVGAAA